MAAVESLPPRHRSPTKGFYKESLFDVGSVRRYDTLNIPRGTPKSSHGGNLCQGFASEPTSEHYLSPLSKLGMSLMKLIQSIVLGRHAQIPKSLPAPSLASEPELELEPERPRKDAFQQKCSSFLKALRKSGRGGKVLLKGWFAFRESGVSWEEIALEPKRCDFRYVLLLDDMPLLHIFSSRHKHKKSKPELDPLEDCVSMDLTEDIAVKIASNDLGNEICIVDDEADQCLCSLLPVSMPQSVFLNKHQSRLAKGEVLKKIFEPFASYDMEQQDAARHVLFVLDCAIKFPPKGKSTPPKAAQEVKLPARTGGEQQVSHLGKRKFSPDLVRKTDTTAASEAAKLEYLPGWVITDLASEVAAKRHKRSEKPVNLNRARFRARAAKEFRSSFLRCLFTDGHAPSASLGRSEAVSPRLGEGLG